jgi:hypothetical protein
MSMIGELSFFLGLQITQRSEGIFLSQEKYLREMLNRFQMEDSRLVSTPVVTGCKLNKDEDSPDVDQSSYRSMIGNLLYIITSRIDIMHDVGMVGRYQSAPKQSHLRVIKRIFKYLKGTMNYGLWYPRNQNFQLSIYSDVDWDNYVDERKITSGGAFFLGDSLVFEYIFMLPFYSINYTFASITIHFASISFHIFHKTAYARYIYHSLA